MGSFWAQNVEKNMLFFEASMLKMLKKRVCFCWFWLAPEAPTVPKLYQLLLVQLFGFSCKRDMPRKTGLNLVAGEGFEPPT